MPSWCEQHSPCTGCYVSVACLGQNERLRRVSVHVKSEAVSGLVFTVSNICSAKHVLKPCRIAGLLVV